MGLPNYRFNYQNFYDFSHCIKNALKLLNFPICPLISSTICLAENHQKDPHLSLVPTSTLLHTLLFIKYKSFYNIRS
ncbi:unnamed protein product [Tenebrio molitor]|nr:unnamed protein product [Tenebrio molitor]